jgi:hypothetical protein
MLRCTGKETFKELIEQVVEVTGRAAAVIEYFIILILRKKGAKAPFSYKQQIFWAGFSFKGNR